MSYCNEKITRKDFHEGLFQEYLKGSMLDIEDFGHCIVKYASIFMVDCESGESVNFVMIGRKEK